MQFQDMGAVIYFIGIGAGTLLLLAGLIYGTWQGRLRREETGHALPGEDPPTHGASPGANTRSLGGRRGPMMNPRARTLMIGGGALVVIVALFGALIPTTQKIDMDRPTASEPSSDARPAQPTDPTAVGNSPVR